MRDARIHEQTRSRIATVPPATFVGAGVAAALLIAALGWVWPASAVSVAIVLLVAFGCLAASIRRAASELADRDSLTGVASRARFSQALLRAVEESTDRESRVTVAVLDCDDFKQINERFGHAVGDAVLIDVAKVLEQTVGKAGTVGRLWGDAFGILLPGFSPEAARSLLDEAEKRLRARMSANRWPLTFSIGISCQGATTLAGEDLLAEADALMFAVKRRGRNGIACCSLPEKSSMLIGQQSPELARQR